jgi:hypothetical protein
MAIETIGFTSEIPGTDDRWNNLVAFVPVSETWDGTGPEWLIPSQFCGLTIEEICRKDIPAGQPYKILTYQDFPWDETFGLTTDFMQALVVDFSNPDGVGEKE